MPTPKQISKILAYVQSHGGGALSRSNIERAYEGDPSVGVSLRALIAEAAKHLDAELPPDPSAP